MKHVEIPRPAPNEPAFAPVPKTRPREDDLGTLWRDAVPSELAPEIVERLVARLRNVEILREPRWRKAVEGDDSAAVALGIDLLFAGEISTARAALAMTLILILADRRNSAAELVLNHGRAALERSAAIRR